MAVLDIERNLRAAELGCLGADLLERGRILLAESWLSALAVSCLAAKTFATHLRIGIGKIIWIAIGGWGWLDRIAVTLAAKSNVGFAILPC